MDATRGERNALSHNTFSVSSVLLFTSQLRPDFTQSLISGLKCSVVLYFIQESYLENINTNVCRLSGMLVVGIVMS